MELGGELIVNIQGRSWLSYFKQYQCQVLSSGKPAVILYYKWAIFFKFSMCLIYKLIQHLIGSYFNFVFTVVFDGKVPDSFTGSAMRFLSSWKVFTYVRIRLSMFRWHFSMFYPTCCWPGRDPTSIFSPPPNNHFYTHWANLFL